MAADQRIQEPRSVDERLDRLYSELAALKRLVVLDRGDGGRGSSPQAAQAWEDLQAVVDEVSALWQGPGAVEEACAQRGR
jgi:hypothetical protein